MSEESNILSEELEIDYHEDVPEIDPVEFQKVLDSRRSVRVFDDTPIPEEIVEKCLANAIIAPNSSNLQPWEFYWVHDEEARKKISEASLSQVAAVKAKELFVVVARTKTWKRHGKELAELYRAEKGSGARMAEKYYTKIVPFVYTMGIFNLLGLVKRVFFFIKGLSGAIVREPVSKSYLKQWAVKTTALGAENLMLSLRAYGFDSCPMEGFDSKRIKKILNLASDSIVVMVIGAGKRARGGIYGKRVRFDKSRFIKKI